MAEKSKSPNDELRPQSGRKAKLNSRNTPDKYSTDSFDPAKFPDWKEMDSIESGTGFVIGGARPSKPRSD